MQYREIINTFFEEYGSAIFDESGTKKTKGIIAPVRDLGAEYKEVTYPRVGFVPKREYLFLTPADDTVVNQYSRVTAEGKIFKIVESDYYLLSDQPFYKRSYGYEVRTL